MLVLACDIEGIGKLENRGVIVYSAASKRSKERGVEEE